MMDSKAPEDQTAEARADMMLQQLLHLKKYEIPDASRMARSRQNIMREVRKAQSEKRKPLLDILELNMPWFFAEPKYGIAAVFVAFIGLQYAGISARNSTTSTGIYSSTGSVASLVQPEADVSIVTNRYPTLPNNYPLFNDPQGNQSVIPAAFEYRDQ